VTSDATAKPLLLPPNW